MDLRRTRTFVAVAELGTVSKASLKLRIAQPALSRHIIELEQELALKLFHRVGRRLMLTAEGEELLVECRALLKHASAVGERAQQLRRGDTGVLKIAASAQFIEGVLSTFLHRYTQSYPNVHVKLFERNAWSDTRELLERGDIHLGQNLLRAVRADDKRFSSQPLDSIELLAACSAAMKIGKGPTVDLASLTENPLLMVDTSFVSRQTFDASCRRVGITPDIAFESKTPHTVLAMAENGHGIAVVPSAVRIDRYDLRILRITSRGEPLREPLAVFWESRRQLPRYAVSFCQLLSRHVREVFPISRPSATRRAKGT